MKNSFETETLNDNNAIKKKIKKTKSVKIKKNVFKKGNANQNKSFAQRKSIFNNNLNSNIRSSIESQDINNLPNNNYLQKTSSEIKRISLEKINNKGKDDMKLSEGIKKLKEINILSFHRICIKRKVKKYI